MAEIKVLSKTPQVWINSKGELAPATFVIYQDAEGRVGAIMVPKEKPTDEDILEAIKKRAGG